MSPYGRTVLSGGSCLRLASVILKKSHAVQKTGRDTSLPGTQHLRTMERNALQDQMAKAYLDFIKSSFVV